MPRRHGAALAAIAALLLLGGCAAGGGSAYLDAGAADSAGTHVVMTLADGRVVERGAGAGDDVCVESVPLAVTMCYAKGQPRVDPASGEVVGHDMVLTRAVPDTRRERRD